MNSAYAIFRSKLDNESPCDFHGQFPPELCDEKRVQVKKVGLKSFKTRVRQANVTNLPSYVSYIEKEKVVTRSVSGKSSLVFDNNLVRAQVTKGAPLNSVARDALFLLLTSKDATSPVNIKFSQTELLLTNEVKFLLPPLKTLYFQLADAPVYSGNITMRQAANNEIATVLDTFDVKIPTLSATDHPIDLKILTKKTDLYEITPTHHHGSGGFYFKLAVKVLKPCRLSINKDFLYKIVADNDGGIYELAADDTKVIQFEGLVARNYYPIELKLVFENIVETPKPLKKASFSLKNKYYKSLSTLATDVTDAMEKVLGNMGGIFFTYDEDVDEMQFINGKPKLLKKVVINKNLQRVFGFESNILVDTTTADIPSDLHIPMEEVYIYADMVNESYVDGNYKNLLGIIPMKFKTPDFYYQSEQPLYFDVMPSTMGMFSNQPIKFTIRDRSGNEVPQIIGPTTLTLEFLC